MRIEINAKITTESPFFTGDDKSTGNIRITRKMIMPGDQEPILIDKDLLVEYVGIMHEIYTGCDWSNYGHKSWAETWKNRIIISSSALNVMDMLHRLVKRVPLRTQLIPPKCVKFAAKLTDKQNIGLMEFTQEYPDCVAVLSVDKQLEGYDLKDDLDDSICTVRPHKRVPIIPGNGIRGLMRDLTMAYVIENIYGDSPHKVLDKSTYDMLFSGGRLEASKGFLDIEGKRMLREKLPFLSIFGTMKGNEDLSGKMNIGIAVLDCNETNPDNPIPAADYLVDEFGTRRDDYEGGKKAEDKTAQMIYTHIMVRPGSVFNWYVVGDCLSEIERKWFLFSLTLLKKYGYLGGMNRAGYGKVNIIGQGLVDETFRIELGVAAEWNEDKMLDWTLGNSDSIKEAIEGLNPKAKPKPKDKE
jgi:CRISPR/Cas system CSM-associated protein Csm3 (group 7 of RAMP superfamily)